MRIQADLYIAHYVAALPAAAAAARRHGAFLGFDAEDFHLGDAPDNMESRVSKRIVRAIEERYLPTASYVTAASPLIADAYVEAYGIERPEVVLNVFPRSHAPANPSPCGTQVPSPSVYWFSQTIGAGRGLELAIEAIALAASRPHFFFRGTPAQGYEEKLRVLASELGVSDRLHFLPPAPPDEMERLAAGYDVGYSGETGFSDNNKLALGNKLFSYLTGGVPILASDIRSHLALAPELGAAMTLFTQNDVGSLARALDHLLLDPVRLASARTAAWSLGQGRFSWDIEQKVFLACVADALAGARARRS
jgi:glycosyltransferase involved in cell wall biosynthesis